jgi:hypothetical protein
VSHVSHGELVSVCVLLDSQRMAIDVVCRRARNVLVSGMSRRNTAADWAIAQVIAVRDDPASRLALLDRTYHGPVGRAPRQLPFRRAAMSFMRWQADRGVLDPLEGSPPGSPWWRAVRASWRRTWSIRSSRGTMSVPERFFLNVVLIRVLYAHALVAAPRLALGRFAPLGRILGDPRLGMAGAFLSLRRVLRIRVAQSGPTGLEPGTRAAACPCAQARNLHSMTPKRDPMP